MRVSQGMPGLVIGADQIMVMDHQLFDKPKTMVEARERLKLMRGKPFSSVEGDFFSILGLSLLAILDYLRMRGAILS